MKQVTYMGAVNLSPDSSYGYTPLHSLENHIDSLLSRGVSIIDLGAVSTRPMAAGVPLEEEWGRLEPALRLISPRARDYTISIDTTSSAIVRRSYDIIGPFIVNDISAGLSDGMMLDTVRELSLEYIAMHRRGDPSTMDALCDYPEGVMHALLSFFRSFEERAAGIDWILDPGLGFAKTVEQNWEILASLDALKCFGRPILVSCSDKRFVRACPHRNAEALAILRGADILRVHQ